MEANIILLIVGLLAVYSIFAGPVKKGIFDK